MYGSLPAFLLMVIFLGLSRKSLTHAFYCISEWKQPLENHVYHETGQGHLTHKIMGIIAFDSGQDLMLMILRQKFLGSNVTLNL